MKRENYFYYSTNENNNFIFKVNVKSNNFSASLVSLFDENLNKIDEFVLDSNSEKNFGNFKSLPFKYFRIYSEIVSLNNSNSDGYFGFDVEDTLTGGAEDKIFIYSDEDTSFVYREYTIRKRRQ